MTATPHLALPYIEPAQAMKHITHNEAIFALDMLVQLAVLDRDLAAPPASPAEGDRYLLPLAPTGDWAGHANAVAVWDGAAWLFYPPAPGWLSFVADEALLVYWSGTAWLPAIASAPRFGINTTADATNRLAVKSDAVLLSHDDATPGTGDLRVSLNKLAPSKTASFLFESNWSARAEFGLTGDDSFHLKLSADGSAWSEILVADPATARLGIGTATPAARLDVDGTLRLKSYTIATLPAATATGQLAFVSDETGGAIIAFSDGTNWRRVTDRALVS